MNKALLLSLTSVVMLSSGWLGFSGVPLLAALVPLLLISDGYGSSRRDFWKMFGWTALALGVWSAVTTWWIWYAVAAGAILSVVITIVLFGGVFMLYHWLSKRSPRALAYTVLVAGWIACEYLYTVGQISFPWLTLGNGFANDIRLVQWYSATGVFGGSLWVLVCNMLIYNAIKTRRARGWIAAVAAVAIPVAVSLAIFATYREEGRRVTATIVQPNIEPWHEKFVIPQWEQTANILALAQKAPAGVDFIVGPETAIHRDIWENDISDNTTVMQFRALAAEKYPSAQFILGASTRLLYPEGSERSETARYSHSAGIWYDYYNTAFTVDTTRVVQLHHKTKLVVGAEMIPFYKVLKHLDFLIADLGGPSGQLGVDRNRTVFVSPEGARSAAAICWEGVFGGFFSEFAKNGAQVMFIISNDGWWRDTRGYKQLFAFSRLRAVETRRAIGRSANTGISGLIDQRGMVHGSLGWDVRDAITGELVLNDKLTFYTRYGDYIGRLCSLTFVLCLLYRVAWRFKKKNILT